MKEIKPILQENFQFKKRRNKSIIYNFWQCRPSKFRKKSGIIQPKSHIFFQGRQLVRQWEHLGTQFSRTKSLNNETCQYFRNFRQFVISAEGFDFNVMENFMIIS